MNELTLLESLAEREWKDFGARGKWSHVCAAMYGAQAVICDDEAQQAALLLYVIATQRDIDNARASLSEG